MFKPIYVLHKFRITDPANTVGSTGLPTWYDCCTLCLGLAERKGRIAVGYDADFVIWGPEETFDVLVENIQHKNKITPYLGMRLAGVVHKVNFFFLTLQFMQFKFFIVTTRVTVQLSTTNS